MYPVHITQSRERRPSVSWNEQKAARQLGPSLFPPQRPSGALPRATRVTTPRRTPARRPPSRCPRRRPPFPRRRIRPRRGSSRRAEARPRRARHCRSSSPGAFPSSSDPRARRTPPRARTWTSPAPSSPPLPPRRATLPRRPARPPPRVPRLPLRGPFEATSRGGRNASWSGLSRRTPTSSGSSPPSTRPRFDACSPTTRRARASLAPITPASRETPWWR